MCGVGFIQWDADEMIRLLHLISENSVNESYVLHPNRSPVSLLWDVTTDSQQETALGNG